MLHNGLIIVCVQQLKASFGLCGVGIKRQHPKGISACAFSP